MLQEQLVGVDLSEVRRGGVRDKGRYLFLLEERYLFLFQEERYLFRLEER